MRHQICPAHAQHSEGQVDLELAGTLDLVHLPPGAAELLVPEVTGVTKVRQVTEVRYRVRGITAVWSDALLQTQNGEVTTKRVIFMSRRVTRIGDG